ncbi:IS4 family transposase, partial [Tetragenococcus halophilus]
LHQEELGFSDKTFRNLLNNGKINWQRFLILLSKQVIAFIRPLTEKDRKEVFIVDDSMYERLNAKNVELCGWQYDHTDHKNKKGFRFLQLGWSDGNTFLPVAFSLLSASKKVREVEKIDHRTHAGRRKAQAQRKGTDVLIELLQAALKEGIQAKYVLFDSWFSSPKMFHALRGLNLHAVCMVKRSKKVYYRYHGEWVDVKTIFQIEKKRRGRSRYLLSVCVESELEGKILPIKLVYVRNRNKRNDYLVLATTDLSLNEDEIIQLYGKRWSIEVYFKICKQHLRLAKYQGLSYDGIFAHTITVAVSYLILAVQHREQADERTMGELFYLMIEELSDISFSEAIVQLLELFKEVFANEMILSEETLNNIMSQFIQKLPQSTQRQLKKVA